MADKEIYSLANSYPEMQGNPMDVQDHPDTNYERQFNYEQGVSKLKKSMADVMDASGQAYPNDPHYGETQDALTQFSNKFRK